MNNLWIPQHINFLIDSKELPQGNLFALDIETNEKEKDDDDFKIVCIGLSNGASCWVYFEITQELITFLHKCKWITHDGIHAEVPWLKTLDPTFSDENIYIDTKIGAYVYDSTRKNYSLKPLVEEYLNVQYPTYRDICSNADYITAACERDKSLRIETKKETKLPKSLSLDKLERGIVANYNAADTYYTWKLWEFLRKNETTAKKQFLETIEMPMNHLISKIEDKGIKIDTKEIRRIHNETSKERRTAKKELEKICKSNTTNYNSPKQVLEMLKMFGINTKSTGEDALLRFKSQPVVSKLLEYRGLQKVCSTYTIPLYFNSINEKDNRIHTRFGQNTLTGRLSSSDPINLQNQPPKVRSGFVSVEGSSFIDADWSNIELYLPAHFSGEQEWIRVLNQPYGDLHMATAARLFGESVYSLPEKERKEKRKIAKETLLTITNSGTFRSLAKTLQCSEQDAKNFESSTKALYPQFVKWLEETKKKAREQKGIGTFFGRWVDFAALNLWCGRPNCEEICAHRHEFCKLCFMRQETEKQAISVKVQGSASDLMKLAALRLYREEKLIPVASIHDELLYEIENKDIEEVKQKVKYVMEHIYDFVVPLRAEIKIGINWLEAH